MFKKTLLSNGLRIITFPVKTTKAVTLLILIKTGSKYEKKEISGISHLLEHMFFKGTKKRPKTLDITKELDGVGGIYNAFTGKEFMGFWVKVSKNHLDLGFDVLSDMLLGSLFEKKEIEKEKKVIFEEINMFQDDPQSYVLELWEKLLYGDQAAGWMISGTKETVAKISRSDLTNYFKKHFTTENIVIALAGNFQEKEISTKIKKFFTGFKKKRPVVKKTTKEIQTKPNLLVNFKKTDQTHLCLGVRTVNLFSPKKYPLAVLSTLLGGIMSSRLFIEIREKRALAYYVQSLSQHYTDTGYLVTQAGTDNQRTEEAISAILKEYKALKEKKVSEQELKKVKENIKGRVHLSLETSNAWANFLATQEILKKEIILPEQKCAMIDKVTSEDVMKTAQEIFQPEKLNLALIGPFKKNKKFEKLLFL